MDAKAGKSSGEQQRQGLIEVAFGNILLINDSLEGCSVPEERLEIKRLEFDWNPGILRCPSLKLCEETNRGLQS